MKLWALYVLLLVEGLFGVEIARLSLHQSMHGFSPYDVSPMIDAGWRVLRGQVPGRDFVVTFPPSLYLLVALSFRRFGVTWFALAKAAVGLYALLLVAGARLVVLASRVYGGRAAAALSGVWLASQSILLISVNYPWHAAMAEQFGLWALLAAAVLCGGERLGAVRRGECWAYLSIATAVLLLSKPNTAYPIVVLWVAVLGWRRGERLRSLVTLAVAGGLATAALGWVHVTPLSMLGSYLGLTGRLVPKAFANGILYTFYARYGLANLLTYAVLAPAMVTAAVLCWRRRDAVKGDSLALLGVGGVLVGVLGMGTNFDYKLTDSPLCLLGLTLVCVSTVGRSAGLRLRLGAAVVTLLFLAGYYGKTRLRMQTIGMWADDKCGDTVITNERFLRGMEVCAEVQRTLDQVDATLEKAPGQRVFFGPALEFLYAAEGIESPKGIPNWWDPGTSFPKRHAAQIAEAWGRDRFDLLVFPTAEDRVQLAGGISDQIDRGYVREATAPELHVYRRR